MKHVCNSKKAVALWMTLVLCTAMAIPARAMHIMEGYLPAGWCIPWALLCLPFLAAGLRSIARRVKEDPQAGVMLAMAGAFAFILSALKIPSVTGSSSHMTGLGFAAILFGPATASVLGLIVLLFQALLLAHGGLTTLGANTFSMGVAGPLAAWGVYTLLKKAGWGEKKFPLFLAAALGDLLTYVVTSVQLGLAHPDQYGGMGVSILKFMAIFAPTQVPLAIVEGILTVVLVGVITAYTKDTASAGNGGLGHE